MTDRITELTARLGVKLDEVFEVSTGKHILRVKITDKNLYVLCSPPCWMHYSSALVLDNLLCGNYTIHESTQN